MVEHYFRKVSFSAEVGVARSRRRCRIPSLFRRKRCAMSPYYAALQPVFLLTSVSWRREHVWNVSRGPASFSVSRVLL